MVFVLKGKICDLLFLFYRFGIFAIPIIDEIFMSTVNLNKQQLNYFEIWLTIEMNSPQYLVLLAGSIYENNVQSTFS